MKVKTIAATYGRKLNMGDFNSVHAEMTVWADIDEGDDEAKAAEALRQMARNHVMNELGRVDQRLQAKTQELFLGLPAELKAAVQKETA